MRVRMTVVKELGEEGGGVAAKEGVEEADEGRDGSDAGHLSQRVVRQRFTAAPVLTHPFVQVDEDGP
jgi:hypothetical protein